MKLDDVIIVENAFTDYLKKKAFDITGQQTNWGKQGLDLQTKDIFVNKVANLLKMNVSSAAKSGVPVDATYFTNLLNGYLKQQGIVDGIPQNWTNIVNQVATNAAQNDKKAINQLANIVYQIISANAPAKGSTATSGQTGQPTQTTPSTQTTQSSTTVNQVVGLIRQLATQGNLAGLQTIANAANRSISRLNKQTTQQPAQSQSNIPVSVGGNPVTPGHPSYSKMQAAAQAAQQNLPESKKPVKTWVKK